MAGELKDTIREVKEKYYEASEAKRDILAKQRLWLSYYLGNQFAFLDRQKAFVAPSEQELRNESEKKRMRLIQINHCRSIVKTVVAYQTKQAPKIYVRPASGQSEIRKGTARVGTELFDYQRNRNDYIIKNIERAYWQDICGTAYMITYPDFQKYGFREVPVMQQAPQSQESPTLDEMGNPILDEMGQPMMQQQEVMAEQPQLDESGQPMMQQVPIKTEIAVAIIPPNEAYPPASGLEMNDLPWFIWARMTPAESLKAQFPDQAEQIKEDGSSYYDRKDFDTAEFSSTWQDKNQKTLKLMIEYWEKPTKKIPRGRHIVIVDEVVLFEGEFPYWNKRKDGSQVWDGYRIVKYTFDYSLTRHWGISLLEPVVPLQKMYNAWNSWVASNVLPTASPILGMLKGTLIKEKITNLPRTMEYDREGAPPRYLDPPNINPIIIQLMDRYKHEIFEVAGVHDITMGGLPDQRVSGVALSQVLELDIAKYTSNFEADEERSRTLAYHILQNYKQFAAERIYEILPPERAEDIQNFLDDDLDDTDVVCERGSSIPENIAGQRQMLMELRQYQGIQLESKLDYARYLQAFQTGWGNSLISALTSSISLAEQENAMILRGINPEVHLEQDHDLHTQVHKNIFDSPQFLLLQNVQDPMVQKVRAAGDAHNSAHRDLQAQLTPMPIETQAQPLPIGAGGQIPALETQPPAPPSSPEMTPEMMAMLAQLPAGGENA